MSAYGGRRDSARRRTQYINPKTMNIPSSRDLIQSVKKLKSPEIRVWCHPHYKGKTGDDYYQVFNSFKEAEKFIKSHKEAEKVPLVAFRGYEINLYEIEVIKED